jgi:hypothetical protein
MGQQQDRIGAASEVGKGTGINQDFYSILELAQRWRCSRGTVYNRLRAAGARVLDFAAAGKRGRKVVSTKVVFEIEARNTKRLC